MLAIDSPRSENAPVHEVIWRSQFVEKLASKHNVKTVDSDSDSDLGRIELTLMFTRTTNTGRCLTVALHFPTSLCRRAKI